MSNNKDNRNVTISFNWFWPSIAAMVIAMMAFGYDCNGCESCTAPKQPPSQVAP